MSVLDRWRTRPVPPAAVKPPPTDGRIDYGRPAVDGTLRYLSPSAIDKADHKAYGGCARRWYYRYVERREEPSGKAQEIGVKGHEEIAHYLSTGEDVLGPTARTGMHAIPKPGPDLMVEIAITPALEGAALTLAGVPIIGYLDLAHARGTNAGASDIEDTHDPEGTIEVLDWKFTGDLKNAKTRDQVRAATPMLAYGEALARTRFPDARFVRLSHVYFQTRGRVPARKVTVLVPRTEIADRWESVAPVARSLIEAARATRPEDVEANVASCRSYGKDCPHRTVCKAGQHNSLANFFGKETTMSLLAKFNLGGTPAAPAITPIVPPAGVGASIDLTAQIAALAAAEEAAANAAAVPPGFAVAWSKITDSNRGTPSLTGAVANAYSAFKGLKNADGKRMTGVNHNGDGMLKDVVLDDLAMFFAVSEEVGALAPIVAPAGLLPPDAPVSNPAPVATPAAAPVAVAPVVEMVAPVAVAAVEAPAPAEKTRKPRAKKAAAGETVQGDSGAFDLYVDCLPSTGFEQIAPFVAEWLGILEKHFAVDDIRTAGADSPLGYNKWKGVLGALVLESAAKIPAGAYYLDSRGSEIAEVVAESLRRYCVTSGGTYTRSVR